MCFKIVGMVTVLLSFCYAQESAEDWFIQARGYEMSGYESLALKAYEKAYKQDSESLVLKDLISMLYLRTNQFERVIKIPDMIDLNEYGNGNKMAEFCCFAKDSARAYDLWKKLIYHAIEDHQLDSALIMANSFIQNMPHYSAPRKIQSWLREKCRTH